MTTRIVLGAILIAALGGVFALDRAVGEGWVFTGLVALGAGWGLSELFRLLPELSRPSRFAVTLGALAAIGVAGLAAGGRDDLRLAMTAVVAAALAVTALARAEPRDGLEELRSSLLAFVYLGLFPAMLVTLRVRPDGWALVVALLVSTKAADIGAYFTGRLVGRRKLIPWISPNKTVEGLAGGLMLSAVTGWLMLGPVLRVEACCTITALGFGLLAGTAGTAGDLVESLLKRARGVKDSGHVLPGFGGILDMIDSPLLSAPVIFLLLVVLGRA
jgi:phosphatidate cytidylyltransferase